MQRKEFSQQSTLTLEHIDNILGDLEHDSLDVDLAGDVLTLEFSDGVKFIINAHSAAGQIWLAAGTQAWHFDYESESKRWIAKRTDDELCATISRLVSDKIGENISISNA